MIIKWLGHSCFLFVLNDGTRIITDPYQSGAYDGALGLDPVNEQADIVTVSHEHEDHSYVSAVDGSPIVLKGSANVRGISFQTLDVYHDESKGSERGPNRIFSFKVDGVSIVHCGDLGHMLSPSQVEVLKGWGVDILLIPVGGFFTIDAKVADDIISALGPAIVLPMHVKTAKIAFPIAPVENFTKGKRNVKVIDGSSAQIKPEDLPTQTEIWVLRPSR